jgi:hypothetical protein
MISSKVDNGDKRDNTLPRAVMRCITHHHACDCREYRLQGMLSSVYDSLITGRFADGMRAIDEFLASQYGRATVARRACDSAAGKEEMKQTTHGRPDAYSGHTYSIRTFI